MKLTILKLFFSVFMLFAINSTGNSQSIQRSVISGGGNYVSNSFGGLYANIGELQVVTLSTVSNILTEGFVQPIPYVSVIVQSIENQELFTIFPNPSSEIIYISGNANEISKVELFDTQGRLVLCSTYIKLDTGFNYSVGISSLNSGLYFIKITTYNGNKHLFKLVKA